MMQLAANLSMLFTEHAFLDRFEAAADAGFEFIEYLFPYEYPPQLLKEKLDQHQLTQVLFNAPAGDWEQGGRGLACIPGREIEFEQGIKTAIEYALVLGNKRIHVMAGLKSADLPVALAKKCYINNLRLAATLAAKYDLTILIEPINNIDMPHYFLNLQETAVQLIEEIDRPNVKLQFDAYHCQIMQGNIVETFCKFKHYIDHIQIAGVPGRHEPNVGELNYSFILKEVQKAGYTGFVSGEYHPKTTTIAGLNWLP